MFGCHSLFKRSLWRSKIIQKYKATDAYKKLLLENREYAAINVYIALCYYKLEYYDVSIEILTSYLN